MTDVRAVLGLRRTDEEPLSPAFRRFTLSQMVTQFGTGLAMPFVPIYITTQLNLGVGSLAGYYAVSAATTLVAALLGVASPIQSAPERICSRRQLCSPPPTSGLQCSPVSAACLSTRR
ncbi:hypothetical protein GCM10029963_76430 [Micromonospora andamanensis]